MADLNTLRVPVPPESLMVIGTGGGSRTRAVYHDGAATGAVIERDGAAVHRLSGVAVSIAGIGLDGAVVETLTPLESVPAGTVFRVEGSAEVAVRADARAGFGDRGPRGVLVVTVYAQTLTPVGDVTQLLRTSSRRAVGE
jgi:hypothetical protein